MKKFLPVYVLLLLLLVITGGCAGTGNEIISQPELPGNQTAINHRSPEKDIADANVQREKGYSDQDDKKVNPDQIQDKESTDQTEPVQASNSLPEPDKSSPANSVRLLITSDFGRNQIFDKSVSLPQEARVIDILKNNAEVSTSYGGSFVSSINSLKNGLNNGQRYDWFYYLNGICCATGSGDMRPRADDTIWWDYHQWAAGPVNAALIGLYPEPFIHGYQGQVKNVQILSTSEQEPAAYKLRDSLLARGCQTVEVHPLNEKLITGRQGPTIIIETWSKLQSIDYLKNLNKAYKKNGMYFHFNGENLELLDISGQVLQKVPGSAGVIAAAGAGLGDDSPLWLISGTDSEGMNQALAVLLNEPQRIATMYSAAVVSGQVVRLPMK